MGIKSKYATATSTITNYRTAQCVKCGNVWGISALKKIPLGGYLCPLHDGHLKRKKKMLMKQVQG